MADDILTQQTTATVTVVAFAIALLALALAFGAKKQSQDLSDVMRMVHQRDAAAMTKNIHAINANTAQVKKIAELEARIAELEAARAAAVPPPAE